MRSHISQAGLRRTGIGRIQISNGSPSHLLDVHNLQRCLGASRECMSAAFQRKWQVFGRPMVSLSSTTSEARSKEGSRRCNVLITAYSLPSQLMEFGNRRTLCSVRVKWLTCSVSVLAHVRTVGCLLSMYEMVLTSRRCPRK